MSRPKLSVCMIARDEGSLLPGAIASVQSVADEVVVCVDDRTTDDTAAIARKAGASVSSFTWSDSFSAARNLSLDKASRDWILVIDADDRLTPLGEGIVRETLRRSRTDIEGYAFLIEERMLSGRTLAVAFSSVRLFRNHPDYRYVGRVHEQVMRRGKPLELVCRLEGVALLHVGYDPTLYELRGKWTRNLELLRRDLMDRPGDPFVLMNLARQYSSTNAELAGAYAQQALSAGHGLHPEQVAELQALC